MSDQQTAEAAIASLPALRAVLDRLRAGAAVLDGAGRVLYHNHGWQRRGLPREKLDRPGEAHFDPGALQGLLSRVLADSREQTATLDSTHPSHGTATFELRVSPLQLADQVADASPTLAVSPSRYVLMQAEDVTQHLRAERGHREAESLLSALLDTADVGLCLIDQRGRFSTVNRAYCALFGYQVEELMGRLHTRVLMSEEHEHAQRLFDKLITGQAVPQASWAASTSDAPWYYELRGRRKDGAQIDVSCTVRLLIRTDGRRFLVCSVLDITDRKEKARELEERASAARAEAAHKSQLLAELDHKLALIETQHRQIVELSAPILDLWDGILVLPIIGSLSADRASTVTERLLSSVVERRARSVILDLTSARDFAGGGLDHLVRMIHAVRLLGAHAIITGLSPSAAQELVTRGLSLTQVPALRSLAEGLRACLGAAPRR